MSESVISTIAGSGFFRARILRRGSRDEVEDLDDSDEDGDAEAFNGLDERARGEAFLLSALGFPISVTCSVEVACSVRVIDSSSTCDVPLSLALAAIFLVVVPTGAGGSSLKMHSPSSPILRVYQSEVSLTPPFLAIVRKRLYSCSPQWASFAASNNYKSVRAGTSVEECAHIAIAYYSTCFPSR